jgi:hypothetical protein
MKRFPKKLIAEHYKNQKEPIYPMSEPHEIVYSAEENLRQVMQNYKALGKSINAFIKAWAEDENIRNRPERQKLCGELCEIMPRPIKFGDVIMKIEKVTGLEVLK